MTLASRRGGIAAGAVTKAYLPDVSISTATRLIVNGLTTLTCTSKHVHTIHFTFESNLTLAIRSLNRTLETTLLSAQSIVLENVLLLPSAGSVSCFSFVPINVRTILH